MPLNDIVFSKGQGGLNRPLPGQDYISGLIAYSSTLPSGFTTNNNIIKCTSIADALNAGLGYSYSDETKATGSITVTAAGAAGNIITVQVSLNVPAGTSPITLTLCTYTVLSSDSSVSVLAASLIAAINTNTSSTGFSATAGSGATLNIVPKTGIGASLNTGTPISVNITGTATVTISQFTGGVGSKFAVIYYHITEYFRLQPQGILYVGIFPVPSSYTYTAEVAAIQNYSIGSIRQVGVYKDLTAYNSSSDLTALDQACKALDASHMPLSGFLGADISGTASVSSLTDLSTLSANKATLIISQDFGGVGGQLFLSYGKSITNLGAALGTVALSKVSEDIGWVGKFNISSGTECEIIGFANGQSYLSSAITNNLLGVLNGYRYVFLRKFVGFSGSYWNDNHTAISVSSSYAYISDNRTIDKAIRLVYAGLLPALNSPILLNADGTISLQAWGYLCSIGDSALNQMVTNGEISAGKTYISQTQNVLSTSQVAVTIEIVALATGRNFVVTIGYVLNLNK